MSGRKSNIEEAVDPVNPVDPVAAEEETVDDTEQEADTAALPVINLSIRQHARIMRNRIEAVMAKSGRRPGDLVALSNDLAALTSLDIPLMDSTD